MKTDDGRIVKITTRNRDTIRIGVRARDGRRTAWEVFTLADIVTLERELKSARDKITRKLAKKKATR